jgi:hypothetical protein
MPLIDHDDIQAEENRRREVAVKAGASPRATKYEPSPLKDMIAKDVAGRESDASNEFAEYKKNTPLPGYNFVSTALAYKSAEEVIEANKNAMDAAKDEAKTQAQLQKEAKENEMKITRTATGQPKVENGKEVDTLQEPSSNDDKVLDVPTVVNAPKTSGTTNPSPIGSGDAKASVAHKDNK